MTTVTLIARGGRLHFPTGNFDDPTQPSLLVRVYPEGDCDTCRWPFASAKDVKILAAALYDERECNETFKIGTTILLPDGVPFDFDALVS